MVLRVFNVVTRLRGVGRVIRLMFDPREIEDCRFEVWISDLRYRGRTTHFIDWNILFYGAYEENDLLIMLAVAKVFRPDVFLDIGANVGQYAILMSGSCRRVIAFEPNPDLHEQFVGNLDANGLGNVELQAVALGSTDESLILHLGKDSGESSLLANANAGDSKRTITADVRRGDAVLTALGARTGVGLIKIDVEGFEVHVLKGLRATLEESRPVIMLEVSHGGREEFGDVASFVATFPPGYTFYRWRRAAGVRVSRKLVRAAAGDVFTGYGNVYAVPEEKREQFERAVATSPNRLRHRQLSSIRVIA